MRLWRTSDWSDVLTFRVHKKSAINDVAPHPSARVALSVGRDRSLRLIDLTKGKVIAVQDMGRSEPKEVKYAPAGDAIFAVLFDSEVVIHDAGTAEPRCRVALPDSVVKFVTFAFVRLADARFALAIGCEGGSLLFADPLTGAALGPLISTGHAGRVRCIAAAGSLVFTAGADAVVHVWRAADLLPPAAPGVAKSPEPSQRLVAAKGFRGTCLTVVEQPQPAVAGDAKAGAGAVSSGVVLPAVSGGARASAAARVGGGTHLSSKSHAKPSQVVAAADVSEVAAPLAPVSASGGKRKRQVGFALQG